MSTFLDKFYQRPFLMPEWNRDLEDLVDGVKGAMKKAEVVVAHNVGDYYFACEQEDWDFPEDFPMIVPPFRTCLVELHRPPKIYSKAKGDNTAYATRYPKTWAVLFEVNKLGEVLSKKPMQASLGWRGIYAKELLEKFLQGFEMEGTGLPPNKLDLSDPTKKVKIQVQLQDKTPLAREVETSQHFDLHNCWFLTATLFIEPCEVVAGWGMEKYGDATLGPIGLWSCLVDKYGYVLNEPLFSVPVARQWALEQVLKQQRDAVEISREMVETTRVVFSAGFFWPAFLAVSFMHCKNVTMEEQRPSEALNKKRVKHGNKPLVRYKTLVIEPMRKVLKTEGGDEKTGIKQALHICRGHFKDYRGSEKGLFGKYKGLWFWEAHVAGKEEQGTIVKDYEEKVTKPGSSP